MASSRFALRALVRRDIEFRRNGELTLWAIVVVITNGSSEGWAEARIWCQLQRDLTAKTV